MKRLILWLFSLLLKTSGNRGAQDEIRLAYINKPTPILNDAVFLRFIFNYLLKIYSISTSNLCNNFPIKAA